MRSHHWPRRLRTVQSGRLETHKDSQLGGKYLCVQAEGRGGGECWPAAACRYRGGWDPSSRVRKHRLASSRSHTLWPGRRISCQTSVRSVLSVLPDNLHTVDWTAHNPHPFTSSPDPRRRPLSSHRRYIPHTYSTRRCWHCPLLEPIESDTRESLLDWEFHLERGWESETSHLDIYHSHPHSHPHLHFLC